MHLLGPVEHPWFDPLWRRIVLVCFCAAWVGIEYYFQNMSWVYITLAITAYAFWSYLIAYKGPETEGRKTRPRMDEDHD